MREKQGLIGLKEIRKKKRFTQLKVAFDLNISREALSYYENGKRNPDIQMLIILSDYVNYPLSKANGLPASQTS